jgi:hypothetical protein
VKSTLFDAWKKVQASDIGFFVRALKSTFTVEAIEFWKKWDSFKDQESSGASFLFLRLLKLAFIIFLNYKPCHKEMIEAFKSEVAGIKAFSEYYKIPGLESLVQAIAPERNHSIRKINLAILSFFRVLEDPVVGLGVKKKKVTKQLKVPFCSILDEDGKFSLQNYLSLQNVGTIEPIDDDKNIFDDEIEIQPDIIEYEIAGIAPVSDPKISPRIAQKLKNIVQQIRTRLSLLSNPNLTTINRIQIEAGLRIKESRILAKYIENILPIYLKYDDEQVKITKVLKKLERCKPKRYYIFPPNQWGVEESTEMLHLRLETLVLAKSRLLPGVLYQEYTQKGIGAFECVTDGEIVYVDLASHLMKFISK